MLHEFAYRSLCAEEIRQIKGLMKYLNPLLLKADVIPRIVLRILNCLGKNSRPFIVEMLQSGTIPNLIKCLDTTDKETQYWGVALLNQLLQAPNAIHAFFDCNGLEIILVIGRQKEHHASFYIAEILSQLCINDKYDGNPYLPQLVGRGVIETVFQFCNDEDDEDLNFSGVALLLNFANISCTMITNLASLSKEIIECGGVVLLSKFLLQENISNCSSLACKALVSLAFKDPEIRFEVLIFSIRPIFMMLPKLSEKAIEELYGNDEDLHSSVDIRDAVHSCRQLLSLLDCMAVFLDTDVFIEASVESENLDVYLADILEEVAYLLMSLGIRFLDKKVRHLDLENQMEAILNAVVNLIEKMIMFESNVKIFIEFDIMNLLAGISCLYQGAIPSAMRLLTRLVSKGSSILPRHPIFTYIVHGLS